MWSDEVKHDSDSDSDSDSLTRQVGTGLQLYKITGVQRTCSFLFSLGNDMPFPSFPPSGNEGNRNGGA